VRLGPSKTFGVTSRRSLSSPLFFGCHPRLDDTLNISSYWGNMLMLPNGEILFTDFGNVWVYQHGGRKSEWLPQILSVPTTVKRFMGTTCRVRLTTRSIQDERSSTALISCS
jgi:hypothetical protein